MKYKFVLFLYLMLGMLFISLLNGCQGKSGAAQAKVAETEEKVVPVQVQTLTPGQVSRVLRYDADVQGEVEVNVYSQVPDRVVEIRVEEGMKVKKGEVLAVVRSDALSDGVRSARLAIVSAKADRDSLKQELERQKKLLSRKVVAEAQVDQLEAKLLSADAQIARLQAMASQASTQQRNAVISAPIDGIVGRRFVNRGDMVAPSVALFTIVQMARVELQIEVPEQDLADIRQGLAAQVMVARFPGRVFGGTVSRISPTIDRRTRTARVEVSVENPKYELMPGMLARAEIVVERKTGVLVVPYSAVLISMGPDGQTVHRAFTVKGGKAQERLLTIGIVEGPRVEVLSGLALGEELVTSGHFLLEPGASVKVMERLTFDGKVVKVAEAAPAAIAPASEKRP